MESGCLPIIFDTDDVGCQADIIPDSDSDSNSDINSTTTSLNDDEDWCLEQIEVAYKKINLTSQLAEYEKRQGLKEVVLIYDAMCKEMKIEKEDDDFEYESTVDQLKKYKPLMDSTLKLKISRESEISLLCTQITEIWKSVDFTSRDSYFNEISRVAKFKPRRGTLGTTTVLPRKSLSGGPPLLTPTQETISTLTQCRCRLLEELKIVEEKREAATPTPSDSFQSASTPVSFTECSKIWNSIETHIDTLNLKGSQWEQKMKQIVSMSEDEPEVGIEILKTAFENIKIAVEMHNEITADLKSVSQDVSLLECYTQLTSSRFPSRVQGKYGDVTSIRNKVSLMTSSLIQRLETFIDETRGIPYVGPFIFSELLGLPTTSSELVNYLRNIKRPATPKYSDASASI